MWTIHAAAAALRARTLTPLQLLDDCLARIDRHEAAVRAWVFVAIDEAREHAERLARELEGGLDRGPLHGIPVGVKDIFDAFDWPTAAGSKLWANSIARRDSAAVAALRDAGAVLLGKTVTTAYASFDPPPTRNPWRSDRTPGGSSSGSAAAVARGMCLGALASQTGGSITRPAAFCGVPGLKPTYGRLSVEGVVPLAPSMDHVGVVAGCVRDLGILFRTLDAPSRPSASIPAPRFARLRGLFDRLADPAVLTMFENLLTDLGGVADLEPPAAFADVLQHHGVIMAVEAATFHEPRVRRHPDDYPPRIRSLIDEGLACPAPRYRTALERQKELSDLMHQSAERAGVLLTLAARGPAPDAATTGDPAFNSPWSFTGLPTVSVPFARLDGLPLSVQLIGPRESEFALLAAAERIEACVAERGSFPPIE